MPLLRHLPHADGKPRSTHCQPQPSEGQMISSRLLIIIPVFLAVFVSGNSQITNCFAQADVTSKSKGQNRNDTKPSEAGLVEWRQWRGPLGTGESPSGKPPIHWSDSENIRWKVAIPGHGLSTPIVVGDRIFVTAAMPHGEKIKPRFSGAPGAHDNLAVDSRHKFLASMLDRSNGEILWTKELADRLPHEGGHYTGSLASASPVSDGKNFFAYFGSHGLYCLDRDGNVRWKKDLGTMHTKHGHGEGSSPAIHQDRLVVNWDHEEKSFIVVLDTDSGEEIWRAERDEVTSWSSPIVVDVEGTPQVIVAGTSRVRGYDLANGNVIWECGGLSANVVATPVAKDGMVFVGSSYDTRAMMGIRLANAAGDITETDLVKWSLRKGTPYVPSPLLYRGSLYFLSHYQGILSQVEAITGLARIGPTRLSHIRNVYASPVAANGNIYVTDLDGVTMVISHGIPRILATNRLSDEIGASLAIANDEIYVRGKNFLYCIAETIK